MRVLVHLVSDVIDRFRPAKNISQTTGSSPLKPAVVYFDLASKENQRSPFTRPGLDKGIILLKANTNNEALNFFFDIQAK